MTSLPASAGGIAWAWIGRRVLEAGALERGEGLRGEVEVCEGPGSAVGFGSTEDFKGLPGTRGEAAARRVRGGGTAKRSAGASALPGRPATARPLKPPRTPRAPRPAPCARSRRRIVKCARAVSW